MALSIKKLEEYAKEENIPIMMKDGITYLLEYIKKNNIKNILEIGTAIGYSASLMAMVDKDIKVTTIERDKKRSDIAKKVFHEFQIENQITLLCKDAKDITLEGEYDLIFIDAAKAQYIAFFNQFEKYLKKGGVIVSDNLNFHGLCKSKEKIESRNVRGLVRKLNAYVAFLKENEKYDTIFLDIGDGISISKKRD